MVNDRRGLPLVGFVIVGMMLSSGTATAERIECQEVTSLPFTISGQGVWCLKQSLSTAMTSGCAITIGVNNVTLDLNDFKIGGLAAGIATDARGICAIAKQNITVRNGTVRGFLAGVYLLDMSLTAKAYLVENIRAESNTLYGIAVEGKGSVVRDNIVVSTGGTTYYTSGVISAGIEVGTWAEDAIVSNNEVIGTFNNLDPIAAEGIRLIDASDGIVLNNRVNGGNIGIRFQNSTGLYRGNTVINVNSSYSGGTNAGDNYP